MPTFTPTAEQDAIIHAAKSTKDNLLVSALAGAAKTSTLVLLAEALPKVDILCLAFNKKVAIEMQERLPANCRAATLNGLGHSIWKDTIGARLNLSFKKKFTILSNIIKEHPKDKQQALWKSFRALLKTFEEAKTSGYLPRKVIEDYQKKRPSPVVGEEFFSTCEFKLTSVEMDIVDQCMYRSCQQAFAGTIDFDDQILMPAVFRSVMPIHALVMVDEAQDLSTLNHRFLTKLARYRLIAVGDPCQAIYGFRGAHEKSMAEMKQSFKMKELSLSTSFRCPEEIVKHVQWRAPHMTWWEGNPTSGSVEVLPEWDIGDIPDSAAVICRNNAPLFSLAVEFFKQGRYANLLSNDIVKTIVKNLKSLGPLRMPASDCLIAIDQWHLDADRRSRAAKTNADIAECMRVFIRQSLLLEEAIILATNLAAYEGPVELMTVHKAKGMEYKHVFILDHHLIGDEGQEKNIKYVACTRSLDRLTYINSEDCLAWATEEGEE